MNLYIDEVEEIKKERLMGNVGKIISKNIPIIDISYDGEKAKLLSEEIWNAGISLGFFKIINHGISQETINAMFRVADKFFSLDVAQKAKYPMKDNMGWKCQSQVPPSTGKVDQSESLQMRRINKGIFPQIEEIITHYNTIERFESECMALGIQLLSAITGKLEVAPDFFIKSFQSTTNNYNSTLRMLNYFPVEQHMASPQLWRAGAHTDFGFLTLLFQRAGQTGLQVCGGRDYLSEEWIPVEADDQSIVCNIGDMLKRLSGDKLVSNFHRVVIPDGEASMQGRNSIAFFCQPNKDVIISDPSGNYQQITAGDYFTSRMAANYSDQKMYMKK